MSEIERFRIRQKEGKNEDIRQKLHRNRFFSDDCGAAYHCDSHIAAWHIQRMGGFHPDTRDCPHGSSVLFYDIRFFSDFQIQFQSRQIKHLCEKDSADLCCGNRALHTSKFI
jgi:hypothetical protein